MKSFLGLLCLMVAVKSQSCQWGGSQWSSTPPANPLVDLTYGTNVNVEGIARGVGGGRWRWNDYPRNTTAQDFADLNNPPSGYIYVGDEASFTANWIPLNYTWKIMERAVVRPLGYKYGVVTAYNQAVPCVQTESVQSFGVEIMVYALDDVMICIRDVYGSNSVNTQTGAIFKKVCAQQRLQHCFIAPDSRNLNFEIYVESTNPPDYDVGLFYRVRHSQLSYADQGNAFISENTEMWCMMISGSVETTWPNFIADTPVGLKIGQSNSAATTRAFVSLIVSALAAVSLF